MKNRTQQALKYLLGSFGVYVLVVACSGDSPSGIRGTVDSGVDAIGDGVADIVGSDIVADIIGDDLRDALLDASKDTMQPVPDAYAQDSGGASCATCTASSLKITSAEYDPAQTARGTVSLDAASLNNGSSALVLQGPMFIYHADQPSSDVVYYIVDASQSCALDPAAGSDAVSNQPWGDGTVPHHQLTGSLARAGRYEVKVRVDAGEKLCVRQVADCSCQISPTPQSQPARTLKWRGFRPYGA